MEKSNVVNLQTDKQKIIFEMRKLSWGKFIRIKFFFGFIAPHQSSRNGYLRLYTLNDIPSSYPYYKN